jgi:inosine-uridine nucleoside N-ribohydrolase
MFPRPLRSDTLGRTDAPARTPVIIDTDIGDDTDDCWALVYALKNPEFDVKLVTTTFGKQSYRAALIAKFLMAAGRTDIPIGLGAGPGNSGARMQKWLGDFSLAKYPGQVRQDGVQALADAIHSSPTPVTVIAIGPFNTIEAALQKDPDLAVRARLVAMAGSFYIGYGQSHGQVGEYNICRDIPDAKRVFSAPWINIAIAPLDVGDYAALSGYRYTNLVSSKEPLLQGLLNGNAVATNVADPASISFSGSAADNVAVLLAERDPGRFVNIQRLKIGIADDGKTHIDPTGAEVDVAMTWKNLNGFLDYLSKSLLLPPVSKADALSAQR